MSLQEIISVKLNSIYLAFSNQIPEAYMPYIILAFYTILITIYAIFIWKFYKFLARRNIIDLHLEQYNRTSHPFLNKFLASVFFLLEYIIIVPILVFFWFSVLAAFLLLLSKTQDVSQVLIISAAIVAATRMTAYYSGELSKDLAKMFPFTVLAIFLLDRDFFSIQKTIERFSEIPSLFGNIVGFLIFIAILEIVMRGLFTIIELFSSHEDTSQEVPAS